MRDWRDGWLAAAWLALAIAGGSKCGPPATARTTGGEDARPVTLGRVGEQEIRRAIDVVGTLSAEEQVTVASEVEGRVARILADLGDRVGAGQALIELDRERMRYRLEQQRAALSSAMARIGAEGDAELPPAEATADVRKAAAELAQAQQAFDRATELRKRSLLPQQQLDDADANLKAKRAGYELAIQASRNLRAEIDGQRAMLRLAERDLRETTIRAPFDAYVEKRLVSPGELVKENTPVVSLVKIDPLKLVAEVPERMAPWVKPGQDITLTTEAAPERPLTGTIVRTSPAINQQTRAFPIEGRVPNRDGALKPGTFARVHLVTDHVERIRVLPAGALQYRYGVNRVFVVTNGQLVSKEVKVGDRLGQNVEVMSGVDTGQEVVVSDVEKLSDGQRVKVARAG